MTFYQELQLNQAGSKALIRNAGSREEKLRHTAIYLFKIVLTLAFCMAFVLGYTSLFGSENSIVGVVVLLCVMVFRNADFGIHAPHSIASLVVLFAVMTFGPRLANMGGAFIGLLVNLCCIFFLMILGCHNVIMSNHSTLVLAYLLLYGYDASGETYLLRVLGMGLGALLTGIVYYRNHHAKTYKRDIWDLIAEFDLHSARTRWQLTMTLGIASVMFFAELLHLPRAMWAGIAAMSVMVPFRSDLKTRVKGRIPGNLIGGVLFAVLYALLPPSLYAFIGVLGGIGVGFSASYKWQAVFNSLGAMAIAVGILGLPGAIFYRIFNNVFGALYGLLFERLAAASLQRIAR